MERIIVAAEFKFLGEDTVDGEKGIFEGYGSTFGNVDLGGDVVMPKAFNADIKRHKSEKTMPSMFWNHNPDKVIGDWMEWKVDENGLFMKGKLWIEDGIEDAKRAYKMGRGTGRKGLSIGYRPLKWKYVTVEGKSIRQLEELMVLEVSPTPMPMNTRAVMTAVKNLESLSPRQAEEVLRDAGLSSAEAKSFISKLKDGWLRESRDAAGRRALLELAEKL